MKKQILFLAFVMAHCTIAVHAQAITEDILTYDGTDNFVLENTTQQWYARNDRGLYERYGVVEAVGSTSLATRYDGKYVRVGKTIYQYVGKRWAPMSISVNHNSLPGNGIFIVDRGGNYHSLAQWATRTDATSDAKAAGIAVINGGKGFVLATNAKVLPQAMTLAASSSYFTLYTNPSDDNKGGVTNTSKLKNTFGNNAVAAKWCLSYLFDFGTKGFLPSANELQTAFATYASELSQALQLVNGWSWDDHPLVLTSTMKTSTMAWNLGSDNVPTAVDISKPCSVVAATPLPDACFDYPYADTPTGESSMTDSYIHFADPSAKQTCVELYDTDGDGELSYDEAAAVLSIDSDFYGRDMTSLDELVYFTEIKNLYASSFGNCPNLVSVTLPVNLSVIWMGVFPNCPKLRYIHVDPGNTTLLSDKGVLLNKGKNTVYKCPQAYPGEYVMPSKVKYVQYRAFYGCTALTSVDIPKECTSIDEDAFAYCTALRDVKVHWTTPLNPSVAIFTGTDLSQATLHVPYGTASSYRNSSTWRGFGTIVEYADNSTNIDFADEEVKAVCVAHFDTNHDGELSNSEAAAVRSLNNVFQGNTFITSFLEFQYFTGVRTIAEGEFEGCLALDQILMPGSITTIGARAFRGCEAMSFFTVTGNVQNIDFSAFDDMPSLAGFTVYSTNRYFSHYNAVLYNKNQTAMLRCAASCSLARLKLPTTVTSIADDAAHDATNLVRVIMPDSLKTIGKRAFQGCSGLTALTLPALLNSVGEYAFEGCENIPSVSIPSGIKTMPVGLFAACKGLATVNVAATPTEIGDNAFFSSSLTKLPVGGATASIGDYAFANSASLLQAPLPFGVQTIGARAFADCEQLSFAYIPAGVTALGNGAFEGCISLQDAVLPSGIMTIGNDAFNGCGSLVSSNIPVSVTSLGEDAYKNCAMMMDVFAGAATPLALTACPYDPANNLSVPEAAIEDYQTATGWREFTNFKPLVEEAMVTEVTPLGVEADKTMTLNVALMTNGAETYDGFDMTMTLPSDIFVVEADGDFVASLTDRYTGEGVTLNVEHMASDTYRLVGHSSHIRITGTEGLLLTVSLKAKDTLTDNEHRGTLHGITLSREDGVTVALSDTDILFDDTDLLMGDVNRDGIINITDVTLLVDYILGSRPAVFFKDNADCDHDSNISVSDVTYVVDRILSNH